MHDPVNIFNTYSEIPERLDREDLIEITKYLGKTTISHNEIFYISRTKAFHLCFVNGDKYLTIFEDKKLSRYHNDRRKEVNPCRNVPQTIEELLRIEKLLMDISCSVSKPITIAERRYTQPHSAPI